MGRVNRHCRSEYSETVARPTLPRSFEPGHPAVTPEFFEFDRLVMLRPHDERGVDVTNRCLMRGESPPSPNDSQFFCENAHHASKAWQVLFQFSRRQLAEDFK